MHDYFTLTLRNYQSDYVTIFLSDFVAVVVHRSRDYVAVGGPLWPGCGSRGYLLVQGAYSRGVETRHERDGEATTEWSASCQVREIYSNIDDFYSF